MGKDDKNANPQGTGLDEQGEPLWDMVKQLEACRVEVTNTINPMVKARAAERAIPITQDLIKELIHRLIKLEEKGGEV